MEIAFDKSGGLVPAIIQDETSGDVLMLGFMNAESVELTRRTGEVVFFSRSRNKLWKKEGSPEKSDQFASSDHSQCMPIYLPPNFQRSLVYPLGTHNMQTITNPLG